MLQRPCPECGFDAAAVTDVAAVVQQHTAVWDVVLARPEARERPEPTTWSPLEYGCHVRDVLRLYDQRLVLMLEQDDSLYPNWDQDATAVAERYDLQDPVVVAGEVRQAAAAIATRFAGLTPEQWTRPGRRSDGARFTVDTFARYFLHDLAHHRVDVGA